MRLALGAVNVLALCDWRSTPAQCPAKRYDADVACALRTMEPGIIDEADVEGAAMPSITACVGPVLHTKHLLMQAPWRRDAK